MSGFAMSKFSNDVSVQVGRALGCHGGPIGRREGFSNLVTLRLANGNIHSKSH